MSRTPTSGAQATGRNDPCPCGSGQKHKHCCLGRARRLGALRTKVLVFVLLALVLIGLFFFFGGAQDSEAAPDASPDRVWSEEHGHWH